MNERLLAYFTSFKKYELMSILRCFGQPCKASQNKGELARMVSTYIQENTSEWLDFFTERDLKLISKAVHAGPGQSVEIDNLDFPAGVAALPFFERNSPSMEDFHISKEMYEVLSPCIDEVIAEKDRKGLFDVERIMLGLINLWGIIPLHDFVLIMSEMADNEEDSRKMAFLFASSPILGMIRQFIDGECYLVSPYLTDPEEVLRGREQFGEIDTFKAFTLGEGRKAGLNAPYCAYDCPEAAEARNSLRSIGYSDSEVKEEMSRMFVNSQYAMTDEGAEMLFSVVNDRMDLIPSFELYKDCIESVAAYANAAPKWFLKGQSAMEAGILKISIKLEDHSGEEEDDDDELPGSMFFGPSDGVGVPSAEGLSDFFRYGIAIKHVAPDAPCPCGSGLSYKRCHGKNLN